jgi:hypothetical protein
MELTVDCLQEARVENLERLAAALGLRLPPRKGDYRKYARSLVRVVHRGLEEDRRRQLSAARAARAQAYRTN